ncbi:MAG: PD-(D/E)XK nuclease-like domain-containing protein [Blastomonas sp.]
MTPIISAAGAYPDIPMAHYHRAADLLPAPSLSSSGAKTILGKSAFHYWSDSPMNPERPEEKDASHFAVGKAAHDLLLLGGDWAKQYHVLPEGFAFNKTKMMGEEIAAAEYAREQGKTLIKHDDMRLVERIAARIQSNPAARNALINGVPEMTLAWQDKETGVWLRARPDFLPNSVISGAPVRAVSDLKFMAGTYCSPAGFSRAIASFGYHQSCAFYADGIKAIYGEEPTNWLFIVVEKDEPHCVSLYELPHADLARGRHQNRKAINLFAQCLERGTEPQHWPAYTTEPELIGLPGWARHAIDKYGSLQEAALVSADEGE